jgi:hypothetical protein
LLFPFHVRKNIFPGLSVATAKLSEVEPSARLTDVLERVASGRTKVNELERLLPRNRKAERFAAAVRA